MEKFKGTPTTNHMAATAPLRLRVARHHDVRPGRVGRTGLHSRFTCTRGQTAGMWGPLRVKDGYPPHLHQTQAAPDRR